jgi:ArsR family transcriptional regulator, lead/cadmium/zinc/bismuth-responsive transcriptional repressor
MSVCSYKQMSTPTLHCDLPHPPGSEAAERRSALLDGRTVDLLAETFRLLGDPTRVRMLDALAPGELCVCDLASLVGISESAVSHQLRLLRGLRLVRPRRAGRQVFYSLDDRHILQLLRLALTHVREPDARRPETAGRAVPVPR